MKHIKAVVFDMDGVLVDAREWHFLALNKALDLFGYAISPEDHETLFDGLPTRKKLEILSQKNGLPQGMHGFINELKQKYTVELVHKHCRPTFKHEFALQQLKQGNYKIGLASNSISATINLMMEKTSLEKYLDAVISAENVSNGKPDPEIYLKIFEKLNVKACQVVVVEDNQNGIMAATQAGAHVMKVENPSEVDIDRILSFIDEIEAQTCNQ
jgi:beta-phosphoglucomutase-like phosphatase (HAD superfamily)